MNALKTMKRELKKIQKKQSECITESGVVINSLRYTYQKLTSDAAIVFNSIKWLEDNLDYKNLDDKRLFTAQK